MCLCEQWQLHCISQWGAVDTIEWACVPCGHCIQNDWASRATNLHQILPSAWTFLLGSYLDDSEAHGYGQLVIGSFIMTTCLLMHHILCGVFWQNIKSPSHPGDSVPYSPDLVPCNFWLFPKLKPPLKGKRFQTVDEIQEIQLGSWWQLGEVCEVPRCLLWRGLRHHCPMYSVSCVLYLLQ